MLQVPGQSLVRWDPVTETVTARNLEAHVDAERLVTVDGHSPGRFRAYGPLLNVQNFYDAFAIPPGSPMWLPPEKRALVW